MWAHEALDLPLAVQERNLRAAHWSRIRQSCGRAEAGCQVDETAAEGRAHRSAAVRETEASR